jgi:hypothetical protein
MLRKALHIFKVNLLHRIGHPTNADRAPKYVSEFQSFDKLARGTLQKFLARKAFYIKLEYPFCIPIRNPSDFKQTKCLVVTRYHHHDVTIATVLEGNSLYAVIFKGITVPGNVQLQALNNLHTPGQYSRCHRSPDNDLIRSSLDSLTKRLMSDYKSGVGLEVDKEPPVQSNLFSNNKMS